MAGLVVNLVFCIILLAFGIWGYIKTKYDVPLYLGIAFGLWGVSHLINILGLASGLTALLIAIRVIAYLLAFFAMYRVIAKK